MAGQLARGVHLSRVLGTVTTAFEPVAHSVPSTKQALPQSKFAADHNEEYPCSYHPENDDGLPGLDSKAALHVRQCSSSLHALPARLS